MRLSISHKLLRCVFVLPLFYNLFIDIQAAEITLVEQTNKIWVVGDIEQGDAAKFQALLSSADFVSEVILASKGGSLAEAMAIGRMIRENFIATQDAGGTTPSNRCAAALSVFDASESPMTYSQERDDCACYSACFVIWAGGVPRTGDPFRPSDGRGGLGVHRPRFDSTYFSGLTASQAEEQYDLLVKDTKDYLSEMDVPAYLAEKMFSVSSSNIYVLSRNEIKEMHMPPAIAEWFKSKCGELSAGESEELSKLQFAKAMGTLPKRNEPRFKELWKRRIDIVSCQGNAIRQEQRSRKPTMESTGKTGFPIDWTCITAETGLASMSIYDDRLVFDAGDGEEMIFSLVDDGLPGRVTGALQVEGSSLLVKVDLEPSTGKTTRQLVDRDTGEIGLEIEGTCTLVNTNRWEDR